MILCERVEKHFRASDRHEELVWTLEHLSIDKGERVLVAGPSGCGKSTLLNLLAGLLQPDDGAITVAGERIDEFSPSEADLFRGQNLGLVFQSFQLVAPLTVLENLLLGARYGRKLEPYEARERAEHLLKEVGLSDRKHYHAAQLSIGEQQRVAIARALINTPPVLLADEPTASLDAANAEVVLNLLFQLCEENGATMVVVSHHEAIAPRFDRRIDASGWIATHKEVAHV